MSKYIDAEKLKQKLIEGDGHDDNRFTEGYNFAINEIREYIDSMPTVEAQPNKGWINVEGRLPENDGLYIVCETIGEHQICFGALWVGNKWISVVNNVQLDYVTHWRPLPEPPKEVYNWVDDDSLPNEDMIPDNELICGW